MNSHPFEKIRAPMSLAFLEHAGRIAISVVMLEESSPVVHSEVQEALRGLGTATVICHGLAVHSGWWNNQDGTAIDPFDKNVFGTKIALIHSEVSEAMEGGRKGLMDSHLMHRKAEEVELADALIRILDLAGARGMDIAGAVIEKLAYNQGRADHKPENRVKPGGKSF